MSHSSITDLFSSPQGEISGKEISIQVHKFLFNLRKTEFTKCRVLRVTYVKDLYSFWSHEYLQVVVEHSPGKRERIVAERQAVQDQAVLNRINKSSSSATKPSMHLKNPSEDPFPLPLVTLETIEGMSLGDLSLILHIGVR